MDNDVITRLLEYVLDEKCHGLYNCNSNENTLPDEKLLFSNSDFQRIWINTSYNIPFSDIWSNPGDHYLTERLTYYWNPSEMNLNDDSSIPSSVNDIVSESEVCTLKNVTYPNIGDEENKIKSAYWDDLRTVGYGRKERQKYPYYSDSFDPRMTFKGLDGTISSFNVTNKEKKTQEQLAENVFLALEKPSDIVDTYLNNYRDCLRFLCDSIQKYPGQGDESERSCTKTVPIDDDGTEECRDLFQRIQSESVKSIFTEGNRELCQNRNSNFMESNETLQGEESRKVDVCNNNRVISTSHSSIHLSQPKDEIHSSLPKETKEHHVTGPVYGSTNRTNGSPVGCYEKELTQHRLPLYQRTKDDTEERDSEYEEEFDKKDTDVQSNTLKSESATGSRSTRNSDMLNIDTRVLEQSAESLSDMRKKDTETWAKHLFTDTKDECSEKISSIPEENETDREVNEFFKMRPTSEPFIPSSVRNSSSNSTSNMPQTPSSSNSTSDTKHDYGSQPRIPAVYQSAVSQMSSNSGLSDNHRSNYQTQTTTNTNSVRYPQYPTSYWHQQLQSQQQQQQQLQQHHHQHPGYGLPANNYGSSTLSQEPLHRSNWSCAENRVDLFSSSNQQFQQTQNYPHHMASNMAGYIPPPPGFGTNLNLKPHTTRQQMYQTEQPPQNFSLPQRQLVDHQPQHQLFPVNLLGNMAVQSRYSNAVSQQHYYPSLQRYPYYQNTQNNQIYQQSFGYRPNWCYNSNNNNGNNDNFSDVEKDNEICYRNNVEDDYRVDNHKEKLKTSRPRPIRSNLIRIYPSNETKD